jgi:hypothetical protein
MPSTFMFTSFPILLVFQYINKSSVLRINDKLDKIIFQYNKLYRGSSSTSIVEELPPYIKTVTIHDKEKQAFLPL